MAKKIIFKEPKTLSQCTLWLGELSVMAINQPELRDQIHEAIRGARGMIKGCRTYLEGRKFNGAPVSEEWEYILAN